MLSSTQYRTIREKKSEEARDFFLAVIVTLRLQGNIKREKERDSQEGLSWFGLNRLALEKKTKTKENIEEAYKASRF